MKIKLDSITIENRFRKDLGDIDKLSASMKELGQLQPILVNSEWKLIAGERRLQAARLLGWEEIEATYVDSLDDLLLAVKAERDENTCRKDFEPTELVALGAMLEEYERDAAKKRQQEAVINRHARDRGESSSGESPELDKGNSEDKTAEALGVSRQKYSRAKKVVQAAEADPEKFGDLPAKMDDTSVNAAYKELKSREQPDTTVQKRKITFLADPWRVFCVAWDGADEELRVRFIKQWNPSKLFEGN